MFHVIGDCTVFQQVLIGFSNVDLSNSCYTTVAFQLLFIDIAGDFRFAVHRLKLGLFLKNYGCFLFTIEIDLDLLLNLLCKEYLWIRKILTQICSIMN